MPIVSFVAPSGTGKTTYLEKLVPALAARGLRVLVIKHDVHGFEVDRPGKDTWRLRHAGAHGVLIANGEQMALMAAVDGEQSLLSLAERYAGEVDLVITEGYRRSAAAKILVHRKAAGEHYQPADIEPLLAVVTDEDLAPTVPSFPLDDAAPCAEFLESRFIPQETTSRTITGVILAGGMSRRMGTDKAALQLGGEQVLPQLVRRLLPLCSGGVIVVRRAGQQLPTLPAGAQVEVDLLPEHAALGGLYTGLALARTPFIFLAACDMPLLSADLVAWLRDLPGDSDVIVPVRSDGLEPLHAIYGYRCLGAIKRALLSGEFRMDGWLGAVRVERVAEQRWRQQHSSGDSFLNVNRPDDLQRAEAVLNSG